MKPTKVFIILMAVLFAGCGGGGSVYTASTDGTSSATPPTVTTSSIVDGATDVAVGGTITVTFDEAMDETTITTDTFTLTTGGASVSGTVSYDSANMTATFTPTVSLSLKTTYTVTLKTGIKNSSGTALSAEQTWSFTTTDFSFGTPIKIAPNDDIGGISKPQITMNADGDAIVVWAQYDGNRYNIWGSSYVRGTGWGEGEFLESSDQDGWDPDVAMDSSDNAIAVWRQSDGALASIYGAFYDGSRWYDASAIDDAAEQGAYSPQVAINADGNAIVVWTQSDGAVTHIYANRYVVGSTWGTAATIEDDAANSAYDPQIAIDADGNAMAVWQLNVVGAPVVTSIWANYYMAGLGWADAAAIETGSSNAEHPSIAVSDDGNYMSVWEQYDGYFTNVLGNYFSSSWGSTADLIQSNVGNDSYPIVAFDGNGNAFAVWYKEVAATARTSIWASIYDAATGSWGTPELLETDDTGNATLPHIAADANGNALAVWQQTDSLNVSHIYANRYAGGAWGTAEQLDTEVSGNTAKVAFDSEGRAIVIWVQNDGTYDNMVAVNFE